MASFRGGSNSGRHAPQDAFRESAKPTRDVTTIMTSRERLQRALHHQQPDLVPVAIGGTAVTGIHVVAVTRPLRQSDADPTAGPFENPGSGPLTLRAW